MKQRAVSLLVGALLVLATLLCLPPCAWSTEPAPKRAQFVCLLRVLPAYHAPHAWTDKDAAVIGQHFERLARATASGQVILAGKTSEALDRTFGLVVFEADYEASARRFIETDPAVVVGIMSATLDPYAVALQRER